MIKLLHKQSLSNKNSGLINKGLYQYSKTILTSITLAALTCGSVYASSESSERAGYFRITNTGGICNADSLAESLDLSLDVNMGSIDSAGVLQNGTTIDITFGADELDTTNCDYSIGISSTDDKLTTGSLKINGVSLINSVTASVSRAAISATFDRGALETAFSNGKSFVDVRFTLTLYAAVK